MSRDRTFDNEGFFSALDATRQARELSWRTVAKETGVSPSTLTRIGQGRRPDVDSFAALAAWAGTDPEGFFLREGDDARRGSDPLAEISVLLRRDPNLSTEAASALDELVKATYSRLRERR